MLRIEDSFEKFANTLNRDKAVSINDRGEWHVENLFVRIVRWIFGLRDQRIQKVCRVFSRFLDQLEKQPVLFDSDSMTQQNQRKKIEGYIKVSEAILKKLNKHRSKKSVSQRNLLKRRIVALKYRAEWQNGGSKPLDASEVDLRAFNQLKEIAGQWKSKQDIFSGEDKELHSLDLEKLQLASLHEEFSTLLLEDKELQKEFFNWTLKNCNPVKEFIEFPAVCKRIKQCLMAGRIGRYAYGNVFSSEKVKVDSLNKSQATKKIITLPFEGRKISILDENRLIKFKGNYWVSIGQVFEDMKNKNNWAGHFEFIGKEGIQNWSSQRMAWWNARLQQWELIDLDKENWWEDLPLQETISRSEVLKRYDVDDLSDTQWVLSARASKQSVNYNIDECHGYTGVLVPNGKGEWRVYDFGKYSKKWPKGMLGALSIVGNTVKADYVYPDANIYYSGFRQQALVPYVSSEEKGREYFDRIKKNIIDGREGNLVFMFGLENCAYSPQTDLEAVLGKKSEGGRVPNLFVSHILSSGARKPLHYAFAIVKKAPEWMKKHLVWLCDTLLMSWRGVVVTGADGKKIKKSLKNSPFRTGYNLEVDGQIKKVIQHIFLPSHLHRQIVDGKIKGVVWGGNQRMQIQS